MWWLGEGGKWRARFCSHSDGGPRGQSRKGPRHGIPFDLRGRCRMYILLYFKRGECAKSGKEYCTSYSVNKHWSQGPRRPHALKLSVTL